MQGRASTSMWWPGISVDIVQMVKGCRFCLEKQPRQKEPLTTTELPLRPFQQVAADLSQHNGQKYLVVFDYYSRYFEICHLPLITSEVVIGRMNNIFAHHGVPETVVTDDGRQFTASEFQRLSDQWGFTFTTGVLQRFSDQWGFCLLYTSPSPRDILVSRMPSSA